MTTLLIFTAFLVILAIAGPLVGVDSREPGGWGPNEPDAPLWTPERTPGASHRV